MTSSSHLSSQFLKHAKGASVIRHGVGHRTVIAVDGEIDALTAPDLRLAIDAAVEEGAMELWIDLTQTEFMDSSGLHAIVDAHDRIGELKRRLAVICPPGGVRRLFAVTGLEERLQILDDRISAQHYS